MNTLRERYFGTEQEELETSDKIREQIRDRWAKQAQWIKSPYMVDFKQILQTWLDANEPVPATHEEMLFRSGTRNGLMLVKKHIDDIERNIGELQDVGA